MQGGLFLGLLGQLAQSVHDNEPTALRYQVFREAHSHDCSKNIAVIEQYASLYSRLFNVLGVQHTRAGWN